MGNFYDFVFIADGELSFLMNSLKGMLEKERLTCLKTDIDMKELGQIEGTPKVYVVDAEILLKHPESRVYLNDTCIQHSTKIALIGDQNDVDDVMNILGSNIVAQAHKRPINNVEVKQKLCDLVDSIHKNEYRKKILVIDDSPIFLRLINEWLEKDYNVTVSPSAMAAFHMIEINKPDLILLDYEMPVCNGAQFLQMLHSEQITSDIPVMFLTSKDDAATVKTLISLKPQGYLLKTSTKEKTLQFINEFFIKEMTK